MPTSMATPSTNGSIKSSHMNVISTSITQATEFYTKSTPPTCCLARYLSLLSFYKWRRSKYMSANQIILTLSKVWRRCGQQYSYLTHSSRTSPPPTIFDSVSSAGFWRISVAASASASCRKTFSSAWKNTGEESEPIRRSMQEAVTAVLDIVFISCYYLPD